MKYIWEEKDIEAGRFIIKNTADHPISKGDIAFARTVTQKIGFNGASGKNYGISYPFTDGMYLAIGTKKDIVTMLNKDEGYRPLTKEEAIIMINDMRQSLIL